MAAVRVAQPPLLAYDALEVEPRRPAQMPRVGHEALALQRLGEQRLAELHRGVLIGGVEPVRAPYRLRALHDERRGVGVELVDVRLEPPVLGALEVEGERVEQFVRPEPDEAVGARHDVGLEHLGVRTANARIDPIGRDDEIGVGIRQVRIHLGFELQLHAERLTAGLQDVQQLLAADAHEAMAPRANAAPLEAQLDVVPVAERLLDFVTGGRVPPPHVLHGRVGEHHSPPEGVVRLVALHHGDVVGGIELLHQQGEVEPGRPSANTHDAHTVTVRPFT